MLLGEILLLAGLALLLRLAPAAVRRWLIFAASALVVTDASTAITKSYENKDPGQWSQCRTIAGSTVPADPG